MHLLAVFAFQHPPFLILFTVSHLFTTLPIVLSLSSRLEPRVTVYVLTEMLAEKQKWVHLVSSFLLSFVFSRKALLREELSAPLISV